MFNKSKTHRIALALLATAIASPPALADEVTLSLEYDRVAVTTEEGAKEFITALQEEANKVCTVSSQYIPDFVDRECAESLIELATTEVSDTVTNDGLDASTLLGSI